MSRRVERCEHGYVDVNKEHFELRVEVPNESGAGWWTTVALVGPPQDGTVRVAIMVEANEANAAAVERVEKEINFYLIELNEEDSWKYAQYHCNTAANVYSNVHWFFLKAASIGRVYERDIDLMLAEEFRVSPSFADWFLLQIGITQDWRVLDVEVSKSDNSGESDLVVLFEGVGSDSRFALFLEDKINAPLQPEQVARYKLRAEAGLKKLLYAEFLVVLCSPLGYRDALQEKTAEFDAFVSYEAIASFLRENEPENGRNLYRAAIIAGATTRKGGGWKSTPDAVTDAFWDSAYQIACREYTELEMKERTYTKGQTWAHFRPVGMPTQPRQVLISLKGEHGRVDLTFAGIQCRLFSPLVTPLLAEDVTVHQTGKSTVIRIKVPVFRVGPFDEDAAARIRAAFDACVRLVRFYLEHKAALDLAASQSLEDAIAPVFAAGG